MSIPSFATTLARARNAANLQPVKLEGRVDPEVLSRLMEYEAMMQPKREEKSGFLGESDFDRRYREIINTTPPAKTEMKQVALERFGCFVLGLLIGIVVGIILVFIRY